MIDVHSHIIPFVDDGSQSMEHSIEMLKFAQSIGVTDIICTPHYRKPYNTNIETIKQRFEELKQRAKSEGVEINLYLGQEVYVRPNTIEKLKKGEILTLNDTKFVLIEFDFDVYSDIPEVVRKLVIADYIPIVAHPERYGYIDRKALEEIKRNGGYNQLNASFLKGRAKKYFYKKAKRYLKEHLIDFVASDIHFERENGLKDAFNFISKKFGEEYAEKIFYSNAKEIIK